MLLAAVKADLRKEWVETPSNPSFLHAMRNACSTVRRGNGFVASRGDGKSQSLFAGCVAKPDRQDSSSSHSLGLIGMVRVPIFFFVQALGMTTALAVTFPHVNDRASDIRAAVKRHVESTARTSGLSSPMTRSRPQASKISACPHRQDLGICVSGLKDFFATNAH